MFKRLIATGLVFGAAALAPPAEAQAQRCLSRDALIEKLQANYGEKLTGGGLQSAHQLLEVWTSDETGSFTVFFTQPSGISCIVAAGENWNSVRALAEQGLTG